MFRRVLVAFDGSPAADRALDAAVELAVLTGGTITVLAAVPGPSPWIAGAALTVPVVGEVVEQEWHDMLAAAAARIPFEVPVTRLLRRGPAGQAIVREGATGAYDAIVMGSRGRSPVLSCVVGSVSAHVVHSTGLPVLLAHADPAQGSPGARAQGLTARI